MKPEEFKQLVKEAVREELSDLIKSEFKTVNDQQGEVLQKLKHLEDTPAPDYYNGYQDREPHKGGDSERRTLRY